MNRSIAADRIEMIPDMYLMDRVARVLVAEPDADARQALDELLRDAGVAASSASGGAAGLKLFYAERPDAVVLSLGLGPGPDGLEALATIRELSDVPVLVLGEGDAEADRVRVLRAGADDFVSKPFGRAEIVARIHALLRRSPVEPASDLFEDDFVRIDHGGHRVEALGSEIELTPTEFRLLAAFARNAGQALTHAQLLSIVWGEGERERGEVKLYVSYLRRKLRDAGVEPVETVRGIGYRYSPRPAGGAGQPVRAR